MEAIIRTNDMSIFNPLVQFLKSLHIEVETKEEKMMRQKPVQKSTGNTQKKFNPREYKGILSHLNLDIEKELLNMKKAWKKNF